MISNHSTLFQWRVRGIVAGLALVVGALSGCTHWSPRDSAWQDRDLGSPTVAGSHDAAQGGLTITGAGHGDEQGHFVFQNLPGGDFEIVARVASVSSRPHSRAGIRVQPAGPGTNQAMAQVSYCVQDAKDGLNALRWRARGPAAADQYTSGIETRKETPIWLRFVRMGQTFAVYKSADGRLWSMISNVSGWKFAATGPVEIGFFVNSGDPAQPATATFDQIAITAPRMGYRTSWVGNSFGSEANGGHVANVLSAMWVAPDGTCYTSSYWDEGGTPVTSYRDGKVARPLPIGTPQTAEGAITGDGKHIYAATLDRITELNPAMPDFAPRALRLSVSLLDTNAKHSVVSGLASNGRELFVADARANLVRVAQPGLTGEHCELVARAFSFERPGAMAFDKRGDLWIIQRGNDHPIGLGLTAKHRAAIRCYRTDGTFTGRAITDVVNPRALGYDAAKDELLVAENGLDLNVRFYSRLGTTPALARTFGEKGGIYGGKHPGLVYDPAAGGYARFAGIAGVGVDARGNLYVGGGFQGTDLRMFTPQGKLGWKLQSLMFCDTYDVDPASDGADLYGAYNHLQLDLSQNAPGAEQRYVGYNWDWRKHGEAVRAGSSQSILRRLGPDKRLVMFTSGQGTVGDIHIFRYEGEIAIPCGGTRHGGKFLWTDANSDGNETPDELVTMDPPIGWLTALCVDSKGDIWAGAPTTGGSFMRHFFFQGCNARGVPLYSGVQGEGYEDVRFPEEGDKTNAWGMMCRLDYDAERDIMIVFYPAAPRKGDTDYTAPYFFARYDQWNKGNRTPRWKQRALEPAANPDYFMYEVNLFPHRGYMGMQMAGDYVFLAYLFGDVHVFDLDTGQLVNILALGPEVNGQSAWEDAAMGLRVFQRRNGEYLIFTENGDWGGKNNFFRWKP